MLELPEFAPEDRDEIASLVRQHPWAMAASAVDGVPVVSHTPVLLDGVDGEVVTGGTVERSEGERPRPWSLRTVDDDAHRIAPGTVGFRLLTSRIVAKAKLSQDKADAVVRSVVGGLEDDEVHANPELAATMRHRLLEPNGGPR